MAKIGLLGLPKCQIDKGFKWINGATEKPRKDLEQLIASGYPQAEVIDFGEMVLNNDPCSGWPCNPHNYSFDAVRKIYTSFGSNVSSLVNSAKVDVFLVIGGNHSAVLPFYQVEGHVVRADTHGDAHEGNLSFVTGGNYVSFVCIYGLKNAGEIWNTGIGSESFWGQKSIYGRLHPPAHIVKLNLPKIGLLDIDIDVLSGKYRLPHPFETSHFTTKDLADLIISLNPKIIGLFECIQADGSMPPDIVSNYPSVFAPICRAVAEVAIAKSMKNERILSYS